MKKLHKGLKFSANDEIIEQTNVYLFWEHQQILLFGKGSKIWSNLCVVNGSSRRLRWETKTFFCGRTCVLVKTSRIFFSLSYNMLIYSVFYVHWPVRRIWWWEKNISFVTDRFLLTEIRMKSAMLPDLFIPHYQLRNFKYLFWNIFWACVYHYV